MSFSFKYSRSKNYCNKMQILFFFLRMDQFRFRFPKFIISKCMFAKCTRLTHRLKALRVHFSIHSCTIESAFSIKLDFPVRSTRFNHQNRLLLNDFRSPKVWNKGKTIACAMCIVLFHGFEEFTDSHCGYWRLYSETWVSISGETLL